MNRSTWMSWLLYLVLLLLAAAGTAAAGDPLPRPRAEPAVTMHTLLEKTIFNVDVLTLDLWLGPETARRLDPLLRRADRRAAMDSVALVALDSRDAWASLVFQRGIGLDQFLGGIDENMRKARDADHLEPSGYARVAAGLPRSFSYSLVETEPCHYTTSPG